MKIVFLLAVLLFLTMCTNRPEVHIFSQGYSPEEVDSVAQTLNNLGFNAKPNDLKIPDQINRTSIIYPPVVEDFASIDSVRGSLSEAGFPNISLIYDTIGEHYYSANNIGLYLVNPDFNVAEESQSDVVNNPAQKLARIYYSNCENVEAQLNLFPAGTAILEIFEWNELRNQEQSSVFDGEWIGSEESLSVMLFDQGSIQFQVNEFNGNDDYGRFYGIDLESYENSSELHSCDFRFISYGSRTNLRSF